MFDETGDTDLPTEVGMAAGGFGSALRLSQKSPSASTGFDNCAFISKNRIVFVEDAGDTLHAQRAGFPRRRLIGLP